MALTTLGAATLVGGGGEGCGEMAGGEGEAAQCSQVGVRVASKTPRL